MKLQGESRLGLKAKQGTARKVRIYLQDFTAYVETYTNTLNIILY